MARYRKLLRRFALALRATYRAIPKWSRFIIALAATITASVYLLSGAYNVYQSTLGQKASAYNKVKRLSTEAQVDYFNAILGQPIFKNIIGNKTEYTYIDKYMFVQALADKSGKVLLYSVTTRRQDFNPTFNRGGQTFDVKLGVTTFAELSKAEERSPDGINAFAGARNWGYSELYYQGNPGYYQDYIYSFNNAGIPSSLSYDGNLQAGELVVGNDTSQEPIINNGTITNVEDMLKDRALKDYRTKQPINTITVSIGVNDYTGIYFGANYDQVRLLDTFRKR